MEKEKYIQDLADIKNMMERLLELILHGLFCINLTLTLCVHL